MFEVYTYFGRVISRHRIGPDELYHRAQEEARLAMRDYPGKCWVRYIK